MSWNVRIRQTHRWLSIAFTLAVLVTFVALAQEPPGPEQPGPEKAVPLVSYLPLPPLALLWFTGMYLFVLPYATRWRSGRRTHPQTRA